MVDNVRSPHNATFHMEFVQKLADHKLNVYQLHASDDQGYSLPSLAFPQLPKPALALTAAEAKALQAKAMALHVAIVAEVDLPGHSGWLLSQLPALAAKSKKTGKPCKTIDVQVRHRCLLRLPSLLRSAPADLLSCHAEPGRAEDHADACDRKYGAVPLGARAVPPGGRRGAVQCGLRSHKGNVPRVYQRDECVCALEEQDDDCLGGM